MEHPFIPRGGGYSYGDAAINDQGSIIQTDRLNRIISFDADNGILEVEPGVTIGDIVHTLQPRGWFLSVIPGLRDATMGGCLAGDVHGRNITNNDTFGSYVLSFDIRLADGTLVRCTPDENRDLFQATIGGMGLTGFVERITIQMIPVETGWMVTKTIPCSNLTELVATIEAKSEEFEYASCWVDGMAQGESMGRGLAIFGRHAKQHELTEGKTLFPVQNPVLGIIPYSLISRFFWPFTMRWFNALYMRTKPAVMSPQHISVDRFFFPLDPLGPWNKLYGERGVTQYSCVIPEENALDNLYRIMTIFHEAGFSAYLSTMKRFRHDGTGMLSYPIRGFSVSFDFPAKEGKLFEVLDRMDEVVVASGGRLNLTKDARTKPETFNKMYPRLDEWRAVKSRVDPENRIVSDLSRRLGLHPG